MVRNKKIDIMKGILIFLMVFAHGKPPEEIHRYIYLFHMPVFIVFSGYLWNEKYSDDFAGIKKLFLRKIQSLYVPFVVCNGCFFIGQLLLGVMQGDRINIVFIAKHLIKISFFQGRISLCDTTWFFAVLFFVTLIYSICMYLMRKVAKDKYELCVTIISCICLLLGYLMQHNNINFCQIGTIMSFIIIFDMGHKMLKYGNKYIESINKDQALIYIFGGGLSLLVCYKITTVETRMITNTYENILVYIMATIFGFIMLLGIAELMNKYLEKVFDLFRKYSVVIICIHMLAFKIVTVIQIEIYNLDSNNISSYPTLISDNGWWALYGIVGLAIPIIIKNIYDKCVFYMCKNKRVS